MTSTTYTLDWHKSPVRSTRFAFIGEYKIVEFPPFGRISTLWLVLCLDQTVASSKVSAEDALRKVGLR